MTTPTNGHYVAPNDSPLFKSCDRELSLTILSIIKGIIPTLERNIAYRSDRLIGFELWAISSASDHKEFGRIIGHLVRLKYVPLVKVGRTSSNMALYSLL